MSPLTFIGRSFQLTVDRIDGTRALLRLPEPDATTARTVPSIGQLPEGPSGGNLAAGDTVKAFILTDARGQLVASFELPKLELERVAFLRITSIGRQGALADWGLSPALFIPSDQLTRSLRAGEIQPVGLVLDDSNRLTGTTRVRELLDRAPAPYHAGMWVAGEAWRQEPSIGLFVLVEQRWVGLLPASEPHKERRGAAARYRVSQVLADGKLELSLRGTGLDELDNDAELVLKILERPNTPKVNDETSPEQVRALFGISKKAFKRALGVLLKRDAIRFDGHGCAIVQRRKS